MIVRWVGPLSDSTGLGVAARMATKALDFAGCEVMGVDLNDELVTRIGLPDGRLFDVNMIHYVPSRFPGLKCANVSNIGYATFEADRIPDAWIPICNSLDGLMVTSRFCMESFRRSGVCVPIVRLPNLIDVERLRHASDDPARRISTLSGLDHCFRFYSIFDWSPRKNPEGLLRAFRDAFAGRDDVVLILRTSMGSHSGRRQQQYILSVIEPFLKDIRVVWVDERLSQEQLDSLHQWGDCFVLPHRGEGFGLPLIEAMAAGNPVIATGWSGNMDFMDRQNAYLIDYDLVDPVEAIAPFPFWGPGGWDHPFDRSMRWAEPRHEHLVYLMRSVVDHPEEATLGIGKRPERPGRTTFVSMENVLLKRFADC